MSNEDQELLRKVTLELLCNCKPVPRQSRTIIREVRKEVLFDVAEADLHSALEFLRGFGLVTMTYDKLGSSQWWAITSEGVLAVERAL